MGKGTTDTLVTTWGLVPGWGQWRDNGQDPEGGRRVQGIQAFHLPPILPGAPHLRSPSGAPQTILSPVSSPHGCLQPALQPLTQHVDIRGGGHSGHSIAGRALPASVGLLGQWSQDEATVAVHLGLGLQPPAHLQNHWSALRTHAATPHQGRHSALGAAPVSSPASPLFLTSSPPPLSPQTSRGTERQGCGEYENRREYRWSGVRSLTLAQEIVGEGSPRAEQGIRSSRPTSWKYSSLGRSRKAGGACNPDLALGGGSLTLPPEDHSPPSLGPPSVCISQCLSSSPVPSKGAGGTLLERPGLMGRGLSEDVQSSREYPSLSPLLPTLFTPEREAAC